MLIKLTLIQLCLLSIAIMGGRIEAQEISSAITFFNQGLEYQRADLHQEAIESFTRALRLNPSYAEGYRERGNSYFALNQYEKAIENYIRAFQLISDTPEVSQHSEWLNASYKVGIAYSILGNRFFAVASFARVIMSQQEDSHRRIIDLETNSAEAYYNLGAAYYSTPLIPYQPHLREFRFEAAIESFRRAISLKPNYAEAYHYMGISYDALHRYEEAIAAYQEAIRVNPEHAESHNSLGLTYYTLSRYQEAIEAFREAIRLKPDFAAPHYHLGQAYLRVGNRRAAIRQYQLLRRISPQMAAEFRNLL